MACAVMTVKSPANALDHLVKIDNGMCKVTYAEKPTYKYQVSTKEIRL